MYGKIVTQLCYYLPLLFVLYNLCILFENDFCNCYDFVLLRTVNKQTVQYL